MERRIAARNGVLPALQNAVMAERVVATMQYDLGGNLIVSTDANGMATRRAYDALNQKTAEREAVMPVLGPLLAAPAKHRTWQHDGFGRVTSHTDLGGNVTTTTYNGAGQIASSDTVATTSKGMRYQRVLYTYEAGSGRLAQIKDTDYKDNGYSEVAGEEAGPNQLTRYAYDRAGNRISEQTWILGGSGELLRAVQNQLLGYDARGRLISISSAVKAANYQVAYDLDAFGNRRNVVTSYVNEWADTKTVTVNYLYDLMNRVSKIGGAVDTKLGTPVAVTRPLAPTGHAYRDIPDHIPTEWRDYDKKAIDTHELSYDWAGNRIADNGEAYSYDALGRLCEIRNGKTAVGFRRYDSAGRVVASSDGSTTLQLSDYDGAGRLLYQRTIDTAKKSQRSLVQYNYDDFGNLDNYKTWGAPNVSKAQITQNAYATLRDSRLLSSTSVRNEGGDVTKVSTLDYDVNGYLVQVSGDNARTLINDRDGRVLEKWQDNATTHTLIANGEMIGSSSAAFESFSSVHEAFTTQGASGSSASIYVVQSDGEKLTSIAKALWGDERLWYVIASANGMMANDQPLKAGQQLILPARAGTVYNGADTFKPYNAADLVGSTTPEMAMPAPDALKRGGCGGLGQIVMIVVAVVATIYTAGAAAGMMGLTGAAGTGMAAAGAAVGAAGTAGITATFTAGLTAMGGLGLSTSALAAAAIGSAAGSIASQLVGVAIGAQDGFDWKGVARSAIGGAVTAGVGTIGSLNGVAQAALSNVITQGASIAAGLQKGFDWRNVAASAVGAAVGAEVKGSLADVAMNKVLKATVTGFAAGTAVALARGGKIEVARIATDAFGNALGESLASMASQSGGTRDTTGTSRPISQEQAERNMYGGITSRQVLGGDKDWLSALGAYDGSYGTSGNDERIPNYQAPIPQVVVDGGDVNQRLNAIFALTPKNIGPVQVQPTQIDSLAAAAAADRRFYTAKESGASNGYSAVAWHTGGLLNEVGYDLAKTARGAFQLVTDSNTQAAAYSALKFAANNPGIIANNAIQGFKDFSNKPFAEQADSVFKFGAGGLATVGAGKVGVLAVDGAITGATATARWLVPKAGSLLENYMYRSGSLAYAVPPTSAVGDALNNGIPARLYHYTNEAGLNGILDSGQLNPSLKALNPNEVRYGNGQYLSDVAPGTMTPAQLSRQFINNPFQGARYTHFVEINTKGLDIIQGRPGVFVVPNEVALDLGGRLTNSGKVVIGK